MGSGDVAMQNVIDVKRGKGGNGRKGASEHDYMTEHIRSFSLSTRLFGLLHRWDRVVVVAEEGAMS